RREPRDAQAGRAPAAALPDPGHASLARVSRALRSEREPVRQEGRLRAVPSRLGRVARRGHLRRLRRAPAPRRRGGRGHGRAHAPQAPGRKGRSDRATAQVDQARRGVEARGRDPLTMTRAAPRGTTTSLSIAPMMDYTDRHFRVVMRALTRKTLLYSEMITPQAIFWGGRVDLLRY